MNIQEIKKSSFSPSQKERLILNLRKNRLLHAEAKRREEILKAYLNNATVRRLKKNRDRANERLNKNIDEWNDIVLENHEDPNEPL